MDKANLKDSAPCASTNDIVMLRMELRAVREQVLRKIDAIDARLPAQPWVGNGKNLFKI